MRTEGQITGRYFLVGCERSGTTLLQAMLACHSRVFSFPESHFFCRAVPNHRRYLFLGFANWRRAQRALFDLITVLQRTDLKPLVPRRNLFLDAYSRAFCRIIDRATVHQGKDVWVEKTPHHLYRIPTIQRMVTGSKFIHILRDGRDVAASIQDASLNDPNYWGNWRLSALAETWNQAVRASLSYRDSPAHILVSYEALLDQPVDELQRLCQFMGIDFEPAMLEHWKAATQVAGWMGSRQWMQTLYEPLQHTNLAKFGRVFSVEQQSCLSAQLQWGGEVRHLVEPATPGPKMAV